MIRDGVSMVVHGESCAHFMRTVNKEKSMRTLKDTGAGKRISSVDLVAMALLLFAVCVLGGAQAGAQSADQAAQIVKSLSSHTHDVVARLTDWTGCRRTNGDSTRAILPMASPRTWTIRRGKW